MTLLLAASGLLQWRISLATHKRNKNLLPRHSVPGFLDVAVTWILLLTFANLTIGFQMHSLPCGHHSPSPQSWQRSNMQSPCELGPPHCVVPFSACLSALWTAGGRELWKWAGKRSWRAYLAKHTQLGEAISSCARRNSLLESILPEGSSEVTAVYSLAEMVYIHKDTIIQKLHLVMR